VNALHRHGRRAAGRVATSSGSEGQSRESDPGSRDGDRRSTRDVSERLVERADPRPGQTVLALGAGAGRRTRRPPSPRRRADPAR
jgi:hypothetical protein